MGNEQIAFMLIEQKIKNLNPQKAAQLFIDEIKNLEPAHQLNLYKHFQKNLKEQSSAVEKIMQQFNKNLLQSCCL